MVQKRSKPRAGSEGLRFDYLRLTRWSELWRRDGKPPQSARFS
jgi:hypothetical protein